MKFFMSFCNRKYTREKSIALADKKKYKELVARGAVLAEIGLFLTL